MTFNYDVDLETLLQQGLSVHEFYGDFEFRFRKIIGKPNFSEQIEKQNSIQKRRLS